MGSHFRGRILYSATSYNKEDPKSSVRQLEFKFPFNPIP